MLYRRLKPPKHSSFLFGPRGTGKSTWLKMQGPKGIYYDLLDQRKALQFARDPGLLHQELAGQKPGTWVILDEIQRAPALLDEVHRLMEDQKLKFLLSGSSARKIKRGAANLLAGRARSVHLFPLTSAELGPAFHLERALLFGTLPMASQTEDPASFLKSYADTYLQEEIKSEALTRNLGGFARFLEVAARQNSQVTNVSNIARDAMVARQTVQGFFEILVDTLLGSWLPAWKLKRATKQIAHPKFYFFDPGVCRALTERVAYPMTPEEKGGLLETYVLHELRAQLSYRGLHYPVFFWSSPDKVEVDILMETKRHFLALEIKSAPHWNSRFEKGFARLREELGPRVKCLGLYLGRSELRTPHCDVWPVPVFLKRLWEDEIIA